MQKNNNKNMADDVDQLEERNVDEIQNSFSESTKNHQNTPEDEFLDNTVDIDTCSEKSVEKKDDFCEENSDTAVETCYEDEKMEALVDISSEDDQIPLQELNTVAKEEVPDVGIAAINSKMESEDVCKTTSHAVEEVDDVFASSTHLKAQVQLEKTEFRHRNLREKGENLGEISSDQSKVSFEHGLQDSRDTDYVYDNQKNKDNESKLKKLSIFKYFMTEITHGYVLQLDEDKYDDKRRKVYTFMKIPREVEKLMIFGFMLCLDCFLFMFTFLPVRVLVALWKLVSGVFCCKKTRILEPAQICDLLKASIILVCCCLLEYVDFSVMYHTVRGQSVIKLYVIYNMLEVADRLFSSFGQDILDALFWTATEPRDRKRQHVGTLPHFVLGAVYVFLHAVLVLFQATCLNVAVNSHNKALLVILVSNQFVELKGSVFKRFERNNLFQMACSDIRERFHYLILVSVVCLRNLTEFNWNLEHLYVISPYLFVTVSSEYFVDWVKHAFITKFNDIQPEVYREYRSRLAKDATSSRQKNAHADHFDLVSRRLGFIPLPLGSLVIRVIRHSIHISGIGAIALVITTYFFLMSVKILNSIIFLGRATEYAQEYPSTDNKPKEQHNTHTTTTTDTTHQRPGQSTTTGNTPEQNKKEEKKPTKSLAEINRYTLCSKEIVLF